MNKIALAISFVLICTIVKAQSPATIKEYRKVFTTYPFSDPNPIPDPSAKIYPYFRYDGFTSTPQQQEWKVLELENDYIKVTILPEIGGKVWSATEKKTGRDFLYNNHVVKFRDVAMRGPWTSGGIEPNYGIFGHTPNCATPVDYLARKNADGSASCIIGVTDLLTQTQWRLEINLPADKAYFTTNSFWFNASPLEQPYYTWMNTGIKAAGNLEFIYPGTHHLGHEGEIGDWPINKNGKNIAFYEQNDFGGYKSYHVFGAYTDFFGGYWHDDDYGMARYSTHDDKAGKKIWVWGLSRQGMIWEKLLTDNDGQYVEVQSGRLYNQSAEKSVVSPFKYRGFAPNETDTWTEYWFPVVQTKGFVKANEYGALNVRREGGWLKIHFCPIQKIEEELTFRGTRYSKKLSLLPLQTFSDSIRITDDAVDWKVLIGDKISYSDKGYSEERLDRPIHSPADFDWNGVYGLYLAGKSWMQQRKFAEAYEKINACLRKDKNYAPALVALSELEYRRLNYQAAFDAAAKALSINTYDAAANYYYGLAALKLYKIFDAKDGFDIATQSAEYRVAAFSRLAEIYFKENAFDRAEAYAKKSLVSNLFNLDALQLLAVLYRKTGNPAAHDETLKAIADTDPLSHFVLFEKYFAQQNEANKAAFATALQNEMPSETCMELAAWYYRIGRLDEVRALMFLTPPGIEAGIWKRYCGVPKDEIGDEHLPAAFPFREETAEILEQLLRMDKSWRLKYALGLIFQSRKNSERAGRLFTECADEPDDPAFYAARAAMLPDHAEADLQKAISLDGGQWRFQKMLGEFYLKNGSLEKALPVAENFYKKHPENYIMGMLYAKTLLLARRYKECDALLSRLTIIPFEGATDGRQLYREVKLMLAVDAMQKKEFKQALQFIDQSKIWVESLGEGKPYDADIDERLENWMSHLCFQKMGKAAEADASLQKIIRFNLQTDNTFISIFSANHLVTAMALEKTGQTVKAAEWLEQQAKASPDDKVLAWAKGVFEKKTAAAADLNDATVRILGRLIEVK